MNAGDDIPSSSHMDLWRQGTSHGEFDVDVRGEPSSSSHMVPRHLGPTQDFRNVYNSGHS